MRLIFPLFLLFCLNLSAQSSFYVSPAGNDANTGTLVLPWKTIQHGLNNTTPGCTLFVMGGNYQENLTVSISGTLSNFITVKNYNNQNAIIDGSISNGNPLLYISGISFFVVDGLEFANYSMNNAQAILIDGVCGNVKIQNCKIHDINFSANANDAVNANTNAQGIIVYGDNATNAITDLFITDNEIYNCRLGYSEGLAVNGNVDGFIVSGNLVHDNSNIGIDIIGHEGTCPNAVNDQARNGSVKWNRTWNNVSYYATSAGIYVDGAKDCVIENNISYGNGYGIEVGCEAVGETTSNITTRNNLVYGNLFGGIVIGGYDYPTNSGKVDHCFTIGNTIANNLMSFMPEGELVVNYTESCTWRSNLIYTSGIDNQVTCDANSLLLNFDFNLYFSSNVLNFSYNSTIVTTFSAWSTLVGSDNASLNTDPLLVNPQANNYHLTSISPAIDMGDSLYLPAPGETDIDTMSRRQNGRVDIGADEYGTAVGIVEVNPKQNNFSWYGVYGNDLVIWFKEPLTINSNVYVYDSSGKLVDKKQKNKGELSITFSNINLSNGIYFVKENESVLKIIK